MISGTVEYLKSSRKNVFQKEREHQVRCLGGGGGGGEVDKDGPLISLQLYEALLTNLKKIKSPHSIKCTFPCNMLVILNWLVLSEIVG